MSIYSEKKGSHVGMMLSFVIFITFLIFLYQIIQPTLKVKENNDFLLNTIQIELLKEFKANLTTVTVQLPGSEGGSSCKIVDFTGVKGVEEGWGYKAFDKNRNSKDIGGTSSFKMDKEVLKVYFSEAITRISSSCVESSPSGSLSSKIANVKESKEVFLLKVEDFISPEYPEKLVDFKSNLKLSETGNDFAFDFIYTDNSGVPKTISSINPEEIPKNIDVSTKEVSVTYVDEEKMDLKYAKLIIKVW